MIKPQINDALFHSQVESLNFPYTIPINIQSIWMLWKNKTLWFPVEK